MKIREGKSKHCLFGSSITWLKIIRTLQVGGVLETSGPSLDDDDITILKCEIFMEPKCTPEAHERKCAECYHEIENKL